MLTLKDDKNVQKITKTESFALKRIGNKIHCNKMFTKIKSNRRQIANTGPATPVP